MTQQTTTGTKVAFRRKDGGEVMENESTFYCRAPGEFVPDRDRGPHGWVGESSFSGVYAESAWFDAAGDVSENDEPIEACNGCAPGLLAAGYLKVE